jgi:hypothetical protein
LRQYIIKIIALAVEMDAVSLVTGKTLLVHDHPDAMPVFVIEKRGIGGTDCTKAR